MIRISLELPNSDKVIMVEMPAIPRVNELIRLRNNLLRESDLYRVTGIEHILISKTFNHVKIYLKRE